MKSFARKEYHKNSLSQNTKSDNFESICNLLVAISILFSLPGLLSFIYQATKLIFKEVL